MALPPPECKVYTPPELAGAMVSSLSPQSDQNWLDPCIGPGAFVQKLKSSGVPKHRIYGIDIDPCTGPADRWATTVRGVDFFVWSGASGRRFSKIIANPPYVAARKLHPTLQKSMLEVDPKDVAYSRRSNYWCAFLAASLRLLEPGGDLAFVLPAAWEYASYAEGLRDEVRRSFRLVDTHRSMRPLFPEVQEGCVVLIAKSFLSTPQQARDYIHSDSSELVDALHNGAPLERIVVRTPVAQRSKTKSFDEIFSLRIGCVTGDANYFLLTETERTKNHLPFSAVQPVLSRAKHLVDAQITFASWNRLRSQDERVWLFSPDRAALRSKAVRAYISFGEESCDLSSYKLKRRNPWYLVSDVRTDIVGFMSGMTKAGPWLCLRSMRGLAATNTLYVISEKKRMAYAERCSWALGMLTTPVRQQLHGLARRYADGLSKLEPRDISTLRLPEPPEILGAPAVYKKAVEALLSGRETDAIRIADETFGIHHR